MRSLNNAICTSGEPVSFACVRNCSINSALASINLPLPLNRRALLYALVSSSITKNASTEALQLKANFRSARVFLWAKSGLLRIDKRQKFVARLLVFAKRSQHGARGGR